MARLRRGADREQDLDQARPDQPFRRDGGATLGGIEPVEIGIKASQRIIDNLPDFPQRVTLRDALLKVHLAEKRTCRLVRSPHDRPANATGRVNHVPQTASRGGFSAAC